MAAKKKNDSNESGEFAAVFVAVAIDKSGNPVGSPATTVVPGFGTRLLAARAVNMANIKSDKLTVTGFWIKIK